MKTSFDTAKTSFDFKSLFSETEGQRKQREQREQQEQQVAIAQVKAMTGAGLLAAPVVTAGHAAERLLGTQRILHGTGRGAGERILREGLDPSLGGTGGAKAEGSATYIRASKNHVHVAVPTGPVGGGASTARAYAHLGGAVEKGQKPNPLYAFLRGGAPGHGDGTVLAGAMPYEKFMKDFVVDPDFEPYQGAFRSRVHLDPKYLGTGSLLSRSKKMLEQRAPDMLGYAKRNPGRVALGATLAAATVAAPVAGYYLLKSIQSNVDKYKSLGENKVAEHHGLDLSKDDNSKKSRKGSIPKNVESYLKAASMAAFVEEMQKLSEPEPAEVEQAITKLTKPKPWKTIGQTALLASVAAPVIEGAGRFTKGFVDTQGGLGARAAGGLGEAGKGGLRAMTKGDIASRALTSGAGGAVLAAAKEGIELQQARRALHNYISSKEAAALAGGPPSGPQVSAASGPPPPSISPLRGSSNKSQRVGNTPIAAKSGVVHSMSGEAMNPRTPLTAAMKPKV